MGKIVVKSTNKAHKGGHGTILFTVLCLFALCLSVPAVAQNKNKNTKKADWIYLDHADDLRYDQNVMPGVQIAKGNVKFRYEDNTLYCDSAYFNQVMNTFEAFGHVRMHRGTGNVNLASDHANYNSNSRVFQAVKNVVLTQPGNTLHCDSLVYNTSTHVANYYGHGRLHGNGTTVTSEFGDYNTKTHDAHFTGEKVVLKNPEYTITTPDLSYNTQTKKGHVQGKSVIRTSNGEVIHTDDADFNGFSHSFSTHGRSTVTSRERDIEADDMDYNRSTGHGEGHGNVKVVDKQGGRVITGDNVKFRTGSVVKNGRTANEVIEFEGEGNSKIVDRPAQRTIKGDYLKYNSRTKIGDGRGNVDYIDHKNKHAFLGDFVHYTELDAIAYGKAVGKDFSSGDTMFVHADTIKMKGVVEERTLANQRVVSDTIRTFYGINNVRAFRTDIQAVCGLAIGCTCDSSMTMYQDPIVWNGSRQIFGDSIKMFMNDSTIRETHVMGNAMSIEQMPDGEHYNQVSSKVMDGYFEEGRIKWGQAVGNVLAIYYPVDDKDSSLVLLNYTETDTMRIFMTPERKLQKIWMPKANGSWYPMNQIPADKFKLPGFAWYDYIRPLNKYDIFRHTVKGDAIRPSNRMVQPQVRHVDDIEGPALTRSRNIRSVVTDNGTTREVAYPSQDDRKARKER